VGLVERQEITPVGGAPDAAGLAEGLYETEDVTGLNSRGKKRWRKVVDPIKVDWRRVW